jgi:DinB family protein
MTTNAPPSAAVDGQPLTTESVRMIEYLRVRARSLTATEICERVRAAAAELESVISSADHSLVRLRPFPGKWHMADVVDHISQSQVRGAEELRHLLSGRRPPGPPVYEALKSGASEWAPWSTLVSGLQDANREMVAVLESASDRSDSSAPALPPGGGGPTACTLLVANSRRADGEPEPQLFVAELHWSEYALLQRLHLLDHRTQMKKLIAGCAH